MQPARASAIAAVVFASVGLLGAAAALTYASQDSSQHGSSVAAHGNKHEDKAKDHGKGHDDKGSSDEASAAGRAHADAMKAWARCVAEAASGPKAENAPVPPKTACGDKPMAPGRAKHGEHADSGKSGDHKKPKTHGPSASHPG